jgi:multidrug efflux pump subunit AcrB
MNNQTQLLCTFTSVDELENTVDIIKNSYTLVFNKLYLLENIADVNQLVLTYNITKTNTNIIPPASTISVHRKKQTNTIYTINAINKLIEMKNNGILDKSFRIDWNELQNTVLVTAYGKLKVVNTKLSDIIEL